MFSKYELFLLDQANSSSDPSQMLMLWFPIPTASLPPSPFSSSFTLANWNPSSMQSSSCSSSVSLFCPKTTRHRKYWIYQTIWQLKPIKFIIKLFTDHNTSWVKHATHQKAESLIAALLSKLDNMVNNSIFNTKYAEFFTKWWVLLHFHDSTYAYNHPCHIQQKPFPLLQSTFASLFLPYFLTKPSLQSTLIRYSSIPQHFFQLLIFAYNHPSNLHQKCFPYLSHLSDSGWAKWQRSYRVF